MLLLGLKMEKNRIQKRNLRKRKKLKQRRQKRLLTRKTAKIRKIEKIIDAVLGSLQVKLELRRVLKNLNLNPRLLSRSQNR